MFIKFCKTWKRKRIKIKKQAKNEQYYMWTDCLFCWNNHSPQLHICFENVQEAKSQNGLNEITWQITIKSGKRILFAENNDVRKSTIEILYFLAIEIHIFLFFLIKLKNVS